MSPPVVWPDKASPRLIDISYPITNKDENELMIGTVLSAFSAVVNVLLRE